MMNPPSSLMSRLAPIAAGILLFVSFGTSFVIAGAGTTVSPSTGTPGSCLINPYKNGRGSVSSGYNMIRCKGWGVKGGADSNLNTCIKIEQEWIAAGKPGSFTWQPAHAGVDFSGNPKGGDLVAGENGKLIFLGWTGKDGTGGGLGLRAAFKRSNGDVYTYNHMGSVDKTLLGQLLASEQGQGININQGTVVGKEGGSERVTGTTSQNGMVTNPAVDKSGTIHLHMNYFLAEKVKDLAGKGGGYNPYSGTIPGRAATQAEAQKINSAVTEKMKTTMDDVRKYMCSSSPLRAFHVNEKTQYSKRVDMGNAYFTPGSIVPGVPPSESPAMLPQGHAEGQNATPDMPDNAPEYAKGKNSAAGTGSRVASSKFIPDDGKVGIPEPAPYFSYADMSEAEIVSTEATRRAGDNTWSTALAGMSGRGLLVEMAYLEGAHNWMDSRIYAKKQRIEAMIATLSASARDRQQSATANSQAIQRKMSAEGRIKP